MPGVRDPFLLLAVEEDRGCEIGEKSKLGYYLDDGA